MRAAWRSRQAWKAAWGSCARFGSTRLPLPSAPAVAAVASFGALVLAEGPVHAKQSRPEESRQQVFIWGRVQSIPGGAPGDVLWPKRVEWFEENKAGWQKISFGPSFGCALDRAGKLYVWGEGEQDFVGPVAVDVQGQGRGRAFVDAQCSADKVIALTARGEVFMIEDLAASMQQRAAAEAAESGATPRGAALSLPAQAMPGLPAPGALSWLVGGGSGIKQMGIGLEHAAFVTRRGELYTVGGNEWGQCGVKPPKQRGPMGALEERQRIEVMTPTKVEFPATAGPIASVTVGGRHTIAMDERGQAFAFGDDRRIQLGLGDTRSQGNDERNSYGVIRQEVLGGRNTKTDVTRVASYRYYDPHMQYSPTKTAEPAVYNRPPYPPPSFIACGEDFTVAVHRDSPDWFSKEQETNVLICTGENGDGQCGRGLQEQQQTWTPVRLPKRSRTESMACGQQHCLALLTTGDLYAWGASLQGQLGNGKRATKAKPIRVGLRPEDPDKHEAKNVSAPGDVPEYKAVGPEFVPFPGRIVSVSCGFRNSAVICEVPSTPP